jgi:hypothetical protein
MDNIIDNIIDNNIKNIIKIQRYYRIYKLSKLFKYFEKYDICKNNVSFNEYTIKMRNKEIQESVYQIILALNNLCNTSFKIPPKIILTGFLINNYKDDIIGPVKDRHPIDHFIIDWSKKLVSVFKEENKYYQYLLLVKYLDSYTEAFESWKQVDKNRTIQNIIISYGNRMDHIEYIKENNIDDEDISIKEMISTLENESNELLYSIILIDSTFDINNLKSNYKEIIKQIKESMEKIFTDISYNFKNAYLDILIEEFKNDNNNIILNLINETNERILLLTPTEYINSICSKLKSYNYTEYLLEENYSEINKYFYFLIETVGVYSAPEDNDIINEWANGIIDWLNYEADIDYKTLIPSLLIEINSKIDNIIYKINNII